MSFICLLFEHEAVVHSVHATSAATVCLCAQGKHSSHASNVQYAERYSIQFPKFPVQRLFPQQSKLSDIAHCPTVHSGTMYRTVQDGTPAR